MDEGTTVRTRVVAILQILGAAMGGAFIIAYSLRQPLTPLRVAGLLIAAAAFILWSVARIQIGNSFSIKPKAKALVTRGIYARIRNPIYVFSTLWAVGLVLALGRPSWLAFLLVLVPMQVVRARREARVLEEKFGEEYREYRRKTWF